ncbi:MAG: hypothetical protein ACOCXM_00675 [Myxococcota bacterium]
MHVVQVKGAAVTSRIRYVRERFGESALGRLEQALPDKDRAYIEGRVLSSQWVPYELFIDLIVQTDALFGRGDLGLCRDMARFSAEVNLKTVYRIFFRFGTPAFILKRAARLWDMHYDSGRLDVHDDAPGHTRLLIEGFAQPHRAHCLSVLGWAERSAELSGARVRRAEETRCRTRGDPVCELVLDWTV